MKNFEFEFWTPEERKPEGSEISRTRTLHWFDLLHDSRYSISDSDRNNDLFMKSSSRQTSKISLDVEFGTVPYVLLKFRSLWIQIVGV